MYLKQLIYEMSSDMNINPLIKCVLNYARDISWKYCKIVKNLTVPSIL